MAAKKLFRSRRDKMISGVAGGLAEYFNIDSTIARVLFVVTVFLGGGGILAYIILWIVIPEEPFAHEFHQSNSPNTNESTARTGSSGSGQNSESNNINFDGVMEAARDNKRVLGGSILVVIGVLFLADNLIPRFDVGDYWPIILIAVGIGIIIKSYNN